MVRTTRKGRKVRWTVPPDQVQAGQPALTDFARRTITAERLVQATAATCRPHAVPARLRKRGIGDADVLRAMDECREVSSTSRSE